MPEPRIPADFVEQVRGLYPTGSRCGFEAFVQLAWKIHRPLLERVDVAERASAAAEEERRLPPSRLAAPMTRARRVYLAGPFTHPEPQQVEANIRSAVEAGRALRAAGLVPVIPHIAVPDEPGATPAQIWTIAMRECLSHLRTCDAIVLLPRWETSRGARVEHALCHRCVPGYPTDIYHSVLAVLERVA